MKKKKGIILSELAHLDAPLAIAEITNYGETAKEIPWAKETFSHHPYCVFERKNNVLYYLYDQSGVDWKIEQAGLFSEEVLTEEVLERYKKFENIIKNEETLNSRELGDFLQRVRELWVWFDGIWWMIEHRDKKGLETTNLMKTRKYTEYFVPGLIAVIRNSFKSLVPKHKDYVDVLLIDEVVNNKVPTIEVLQARLKTFAYTDRKLFNSIQDVKDAHGITIKEEPLVRSLELRGQIAYPGKVRGEVKIVKNRKDIKKFKEGNIIVSSTTTPDFLPIMKMSAAIISEHGGVISHASITSRELKIPCIVGVKGATKTLKDGMMVEVDAEKGIVRILN